MDIIGVYKVSHALIGPIHLAHDFTLDLAANFGPIGRSVGLTTLLPILASHLAQARFTR